jgi:hypothetical protein
VGYCCPPGSGYGSTDLTKSGSNPDPKHWLFKILSIAARGPVRTFSHAAAATQEPAHLAQGADHQQEEDVQVVTHPRSLHSFTTLYSSQDSSVADPGCFSRILILSVLDPGSKKGNKRFTFFVAIYIKNCK